MTETVSGRTLLSHRPNARTFVLWRVEAESGTHYHKKLQTCLKCRFVLAQT
jgi:hypothetical protein